jgi:RND family efflux transporter MFP subunit
MSLPFPTLLSRLGILLPLAWLLLGLPGCTKTPASEEEVRYAPVKTAAPRLLSIGQWTELLGTTQPLPERLARITAPFDGRLTAVLRDARGQPLQEGQTVKAGDVIAQLDVRLIEDGRAEAVATLHDLDEQKKQADITVEQAELEVKRLTELQALDRSANSQGLVRPLEMQKAQFVLQDAQSKQRGVIAKQAAGQAKLKALTDQLEMSQLRAPIAGRLGLLQVGPGQSLKLGDTVADVVDLEEIDLLCYAPPHVATTLSLKMPARIKSSGESPATDPLGKVVFIAWQAHAETGNIPVKIRFPNAALRLRANAVLAVEVQTQPDKERLTVPDSALLEDQDPPGIILFQDLKVEKNKDGKEEKRGKAVLARARLGVRDRTWHVAEILSLENAETKTSIPLRNALIVVEGGHGLHDGDLVKILEEED